MDKLRTHLLKKIANSQIGFPKLGVSQVGFPKLGFPTWVSQIVLICARFLLIYVDVCWCWFWKWTVYLKWTYKLLYLWYTDTLFHSFFTCFLKRAKWKIRKKQLENGLDTRSVQYFWSAYWKAIVFLIHIDPLSIVFYVFIILFVSEKHVKNKWKRVSVYQKYNSSNLAWISSFYLRVRCSPAPQIEISHFLSEGALR